MYEKFSAIARHTPMAFEGASFIDVVIKHIGQGFVLFGLSPRHLDALVTQERHLTPACLLDACAVKEVGSPSYICLLCCYFFL